MVEFFDLFNSFSSAFLYLAERYKTTSFLTETVFLYLLAGGVFLVLYVLQAIGLYTAAKRAGNDKAWFAFVPFLNYVLLGRLAGQVTFLSRKIKRGGLYLAVADAAYGVVSIFQLVVQAMLKPYLREIDSFTYEYVGYPQNLAWANGTDTVLNFVLPFLSLVYLVFLIVVTAAFFRKYAMRNAVAFTVASVILPVKGVLIFAVRKNKPLDFSRYARSGFTWHSPERGFEKNTTEKWSGNDPFEEFSKRNSGGQEEKSDKAKYSDNDDFFS